MISWIFQIMAFTSDLTIQNAQAIGKWIQLILTMRENILIGFRK